jgi:hypothetical protein
MEEKDYIMRMIRQFFAALASILFYKKIQSYEQEQREIENASKSLLGLDFDLIKSLEAENIIEKLSHNNDIDYDKLLITGRLLFEYAEIHKINQTIPLAFEFYSKSFKLYMKLLMSDYEIQKDMDVLDDIVIFLNEYELNNDTKFLLSIYYEKIGKFAKAEDLIYELVEKNYDSIFKHAQDFYLRLMSKQDEALIKGDLSKDELQEGLNYIKKIYPTTATI